MAVLLLISRFILFAVLAVASVAKFADIAGSREAIRNFGLSAKLSKPFGTLLPFLEGAIALSLILDVTAWFGAIGALLLFILFIAVVSLTLARGKTPDCHCFGQLHSEPIGRNTLIRNGFLAILAVFVISRGPKNISVDVFGWLWNLAAQQLIYIVVIAILSVASFLEGWLLLNILRQQGRLLKRIESLESQEIDSEPRILSAASQSVSGLAPGSDAVKFQLLGVDGQTWTLDTILNLGKPIILIFSDPGCGPCRALLPSVAKWQHSYSDVLIIVLISRGQLEDNRVKTIEHGITYVLVQKDREVAQAYDVRGTPSAVLVGLDGKIASDTVVGANGIEQLVMQSK